MKEVKMFQVAIKNKEPNGPFFETLAEAKREIQFLKNDDKKAAHDAMKNGGVELEIYEYEIYEVNVVTKDKKKINA